MNEWNRRMVSELVTLYAEAGRISSEQEETLEARLAADDLPGALDDLLRYADGR